MKMRAATATLLLLLLGVSLLARSQESALTASQLLEASRDESLPPEAALDLVLGTEPSHLVTSSLGLWQALQEGAGQQGITVVELQGAPAPLPRRRLLQRAPPRSHHRL